MSAKAINHNASSTASVFYNEFGSVGHVYQASAMVFSSQPVMSNPMYTQQPEHSFVAPAMSSLQQYGTNDALLKPSFQGQHSSRIPVQSNSTQSERYSQTAVVSSA